MILLGDFFYFYRILQKYAKFASSVWISEKLKSFQWVTLWCYPYSVIISHMLACKHYPTDFETLKKIVVVNAVSACFTNISIRNDRFESTSWSQNPAIFLWKSFPVFVSDILRNIWQFLQLLTCTTWCTKDHICASILIKTPFSHQQN